MTYAVDSAQASGLDVAGPDRHNGACDGAAGKLAVPDDSRPPQPVLPPEFSWHDYTVMLLHAAAKIEHSLMVQYLYA